MLFSNLTPGPRFLCQLAIKNLPTITLWYALFRLGVYFSAVSVSKWLAIPAVLSAQLVFILAGVLWRVYQDKKDAEVKGAVFVPRVRVGRLESVAAISKSVTTGYPGDIFNEWREQCGNTYTIGIVTEDVVLTFEPEYIKAVLATQFDLFEKGPVFRSQFYGFLGTGVFNADGDMWKFHRSITRPFFNKERIIDFDIFDRHASDAIGQVVDRLNAGYPVDFQDVVSRFTIDSATEFLFGNDIRTLSAGLPYPPSSPLADSDAFVNHPSNKFASAFTTGQYLTVRRTDYGAIWPLGEFWTDKVKPHRKVVDQFIEPILAEALSHQAAAADGTYKANFDAEKETLLTHLISQTQDSQVLKDELVNLLVAGRDTTASTLTFGIYMLTQHPEVTQRLREEIFSKVGNSNPTFEQMKDMKYLRAFINETLRLYPPVPTDVRTSNKATTFPSTIPGQKPFYIPTNSSVFLMHRRTDLWGPDADKFDPDRFIDDRLGKYLIPNPFIFLPFNAGPRICLGQQFAYHEVSLFLIRLLQRFSSFTLAEDAQPADARPPPEWAVECKGTKSTDKIWPGIHMTMFVRGGLWVRME